MKALLTYSDINITSIISTKQRTSFLVNARVYLDEDMALDGAPFKKKANKSSSCSYNQDWEKTLPITSVRKNPGFFYYIPCSKMLSCAKIDRRDVERHCDPTKEDSLRNKNLKAKKISAQRHYFFPA